MGKCEIVFCLSDLSSLPYLSRSVHYRKNGKGFFEHGKMQHILLLCSILANLRRIAFTSYG